MDSPFLTMVFVGLGFFFSRFAPLVQSQENVNPGAESSPSPPSLPPPPPPPPSPSLYSPPPPSSRRPQPPPRRRSKAPARSLPPRNRSPPAKTSLPPKENLNLGKKLGLVFAGIVGMMQVGVVAFLVITSLQLLKNNGRL